VVPFSTALDWARKGAMPEVLPTACGSLTIGLDAKPGEIPLTNRKLAARASGQIDSTERNLPFGDRLKQNDPAYRKVP
jgi:hypothetical protein